MNIVECRERCREEMNRREKYEMGNAKKKEIKGVVIPYLEIRNDVP